MNRKKVNDTLKALAVATALGAFFLGVALAHAEDAPANVIVPKTSELLNDNVAYRVGELAVIPNLENNTAQMFVGGENNKPLQVIDNASLRSQTTNKVLPNRYSIQIGAGVSSPSNGVYQVATTNDLQAADVWVRVYPLAGAKITDVTFEQDGELLYDTGGMFEPNEPRWDATVYDDYVEFKMVEYNGVRAGWLWNIRNIECYSLNRYQDGYINDTSVNKFYIKDIIGTYDLYTMRRYLLNYYNGNRGEDWYKYDAQSSVDLAGNALMFNGGEGYFMHQNGDSFGLHGGGRSLLTTEVGGLVRDDNVTNITITAFRVLNNNANVEIDATLKGKNADGFDFADVKVMYTASIEKDAVYWYPIDYVPTPMSPSQTVNGSGVDYHYTFSIPNPSSSATQGFFRITYQGLGSKTISVVFHADVKMLGGLYLQGDDGILYRIKINGGTISAEIAN